MENTVDKAVKTMEVRGQMVTGHIGGSLHRLYNESLATVLHT